MNPAEDVKPMRSRSRRKIAWICWCVLAAALLVVLFNVGFVVVEINRTVPAPKLESPFKFTTAKSSDVKTSSTPTRAKIAFFDRYTSKTIDLDGPCLDAKTTVNETTAENIRAVNEGYMRTLQAYMAYLQDEPGLDYIQAQKKLNEIVGGWVDVSIVYVSDPTLPPMENARFIAVNELYYQLSLKKAVKHEQWYAAGILCHSDRRSWEEQVYYFQKAGKPGKYAIAMFMSQRYWNALSRSIRSIGPDFHWPRLEDE